jgi:hypothetical protein
MQVSITLGNVLAGSVAVETSDAQETAADTEMGDDDSSLRAAATVWNALRREGVFTVNGRSFTATECAEWWA